MKLSKLPFLRGTIKQENFASNIFDRSDIEMMNSSHLSDSTHCKNTTHYTFENCAISDCDLYMCKIVNCDLINVNMVSCILADSSATGNHIFSSIVDSSIVEDYKFIYSIRSKVSTFSNIDLLYSCELQDSLFVKFNTLRKCLLHKCVDDPKSVNEYLDTFRIRLEN